MNYWQWIGENYDQCQIVVSAISIVIGIVGGIVAIVTWRSSIKTNRENNELLNKPKFEFYGSMGCQGRISSSDDQEKCMPYPTKCPEHNHCNKLHWFDIKNVGNFDAGDVKIGIFYESEINNLASVSNIMQRFNIFKHIQSGDIVQVKLNPDAIPMPLNFDSNHKQNYAFYVLLEFCSEYSHLIYKKVYELCSTTSDIKASTSDNSWEKNIVFFSITEEKATCGRRRKIGFRKQTPLHTIDDWLNDFSKKGRKYE